MKMIIAIVNDGDASTVTNNLNKNGYRVTKISSTGGFLKTGNTTLLIGVEEAAVDHVIEIIERNSKSRKELLLAPQLENSLYMSSPKEVSVGGATIFVTDVERFEKV